MGGGWGVGAHMSSPLTLSYVYQRMCVWGTLHTLPLSSSAQALHTRSPPAPQFPPTSISLCKISVPSNTVWPPGVVLSLFSHKNVVIYTHFCFLQRRGVGGVRVGL